MEDEQSRKYEQDSRHTRISFRLQAYRINYFTSVVVHNVDMSACQIYMVIDFSCIVIRKFFYSNKPQSCKGIFF